MLTLLERIATEPGRDDINALAALVALIRPAKPSQGTRATANLRTLIQLLRENPEHAAGLRHYLLRVLATRRHTTLYADTGILPSDGFFTELFRRLSLRVLPPALDDLYLSDGLDRILSADTDYVWMRAIPASDWLALFDAVACNTVAADATQPPTDIAERYSARLEMLEAIQMLSHRISAMGLEPSLVRIHPDLENFESPFLMQNVECHRFLDGELGVLNGTGAVGDDAAHLLVMLEQCDVVITRIRKNALHLGTSVALTYLLVRLSQSILRLRRLLTIVDPALLDGVPVWSDARRHFALALALDLAQAHNQKYALRSLFADNIHLLARNVTENASHTGEHYIAEDRSEYAAMLRSSAGAGFIVAFMALLKIQASYLRTAPLIEAFLYSLNYSFGFMLIHVLHFTVATKQPAMTAARIAADLHSCDSRNIDIDRLADLIVKVLRTQFIAVFGNLLMVFPTAVVLAMLWLQLNGHHLISPGKARHLLHDIDPFASLALFHAAVAGVCLFLAGMISGYFDNRAVYTHMAQRVLRLQGLRRLLGPSRHVRFAHYLENNLGGLMGNFFFGILLGTIGTVGELLGLPIDIRHITFSASNLATAWVALDHAISWQILAVSCTGVVLIGCTNLLVSFALALFVALRSRQVRFIRGWALCKALLLRLARSPLDFVIAPKTVAVLPEPAE